MARGTRTWALNHATTSIVIFAASGRGRRARRSATAERRFDAHFTWRTGAVTRDRLATTANVGVRTTNSIGGTFRGAVATVVVRAVRVVIADLWFGATALAVDEDAALLVQAARRPWLGANPGRRTTGVVLTAEQLGIGPTALSGDDSATDVEWATDGVWVSERIATAVRGANLARAALTAGRRVTVDENAAGGMAPRSLAQLRATARRAGHGRATVRCFTAAELTRRALTTVDGLAAARVHERAAGFGLTHQQGVTLTGAGCLITARSFATTRDATVQRDVSAVEVRADQLLASHAGARGEQQRRHGTPGDGVGHVG